MRAHDNVIDPVTVTPPGTAHPATAAAGLGLGLLGVLAFSFSLPANKLAVGGIDPVSITVLRAAAAGVLAAAYILVVRAGIPRRADVLDLALSALGVVVGFPLFSSIALETSDSGHSAVILGLLPALTALFGALVGGERLPRGFWVASLSGVVVLVGYLVAHGWAQSDVLAVGTGDLWMLAAAASAGFGYAMGARQARVMGGARAISWSLVLVLPVAAPLSVVLLATRQYDWTWPVAAGMAYLVVVSQFIAFFAWYGGLARGGIARVGQLQQVQPLLTIVWSSLLLGELFDPWTIVVGIAVAVCVWLAQRARFARARRLGVRSGSGVVRGHGCHDLSGQLPRGARAGVDDDADALGQVRGEPSGVHLQGELDALGELLRVVGAGEDTDDRGAAVALERDGREAVVGVAEHVDLRAAEDREQRLGVDVARLRVEDRLLEAHLGVGQLELLDARELGEDGRDAPRRHLESEARAGVDDEPDARLQRLEHTPAEHRRGVGRLRRPRVGAVARGEHRELGDVVACEHHRLEEPGVAREVGGRDEDDARLGEESEEVAHAECARHRRRERRLDPGVRRAGLSGALLSHGFELTDWPPPARAA
jgi:drug/metabolite transporter (DMT)-like permease